MGQLSPARCKRLAQVKQVLWWHVSPWTITPLGFASMQITHSVTPPAGIDAVP